MKITLATMQANAAGAPTCSGAPNLFSLNTGSSSGDGLPPFVKTAAGGNGSCHCRCVGQLMVQVQALAVQRGAAAAAQREPRLPHMRQYPPGVPGAQTSAAEAIDTNGPMKLSLPLGLLGSERRDKSIYDDKMMTQPEYRFDGTKGGASWKSNI